MSKYVTSAKTEKLAIPIDKRTKERIRKAAAETGVSMACYVRFCVVCFLDGTEESETASGK